LKNAAWLWLWMPESRFWMFCFSGFWPGAEKADGKSKKVKAGERATVSFPAFRILYYVCMYVYVYIV
jgi:hypothetical protein